MRNKLTERDLSRIVKRVINEQAEKMEKGPFPIAPGAPMNLYIYSKNGKFYIYFTNATQKTPIPLDGSINNNSGKGFNTLEDALNRKDAYISENNQPSNDDDNVEFGDIEESYLSRIVKRVIKEDKDRKKSMNDISDEFLDNVFKKVSDIIILKEFSDVEDIVGKTVGNYGSNIGEVIEHIYREAISRRRNKK